MLEEGGGGQLTDFRDALRLGNPHCGQSQIKFRLAYCCGTNDLIIIKMLNEPRFEADQGERVDWTFTTELS